MGESMREMYGHQLTFPAKRSCSLGFSLVELAIVLVILGLLAGGVLSGQSLIRAAELRSVIAEYQRYYTAVKIFNDEGAVPDNA